MCVKIQPAGDEQSTCTSKQNKQQDGITLIRFDTALPSCFAIRFGEANEAELSNEVNEVIGE